MTYEMPDQISRVHDGLDDALAVTIDNEWELTGDPDLWQVHLLLQVAHERVRQIRGNYNGKPRA